MPISTSIRIDALPLIYPTVEAAPNGTLLQCKLRQGNEPIIGIRTEIFDHAINRQGAGIVPLEGPQRGVFIKQGHFYGHGAFDVTGSISINVNLSPRANASKETTGFLYLDTTTNAIWMWSDLDDMVGWICVHPAGNLNRGQLEQGGRLTITNMIELGEPVIEPVE
jgi:hypothetical protein